MSIEQLTVQKVAEKLVKEVAEKLVKEGVFVGYVRDCKTEEWEKDVITGFELSPDTLYKFFTKTGRFTCGDVIVSKDYGTNVLITMTNKEQLITRGYCLILKSYLCFRMAYK